MTTVFDMDGNPHTAITVFRFDASATERVIVGTTRVFFACKACRRAWSETRPATLQTIIQSERMTVNLKSVVVRRVLDRVLLNADATCCGRSTVGKALQTGSKTLHECDKRCSDAKGNECNCSCKGLHHGSGIDLAKVA